MLDVTAPWHHCGACREPRTCLALNMSDYTNHVDPYHVLQVQRHAAPEVVRAAYRALAWKYHPDRGASAEGMVVLNHAWSILGDPKRRAEYDAGAPPRPSVVAQPATPRATDIDVSPPPDHGLASRRQAPDATSTVIDFGRYDGWTIRQLVDHDPDYLRWLARTPVGRRLAAEIDIALSGRERVAVRA
jgi:curved DNA-binding protein CbpA